MSSSVLSRFSPATRAWFEGAFAEPTPAQAGAWEAIGAGAHTLVVAPTGSGKTLAAFLWALDRVAAQQVPEVVTRRCRVLYVSPMKALAVDVERNLRAPLVGIGRAATRLGMAPPQVSVSVRSGDTPANERRSFARTPSDVLITTPESLFLLLTSAAREALRGVETVIIDEVHAVAGTKRGAHLALSLERLDTLLDQPAQRVGLSATVRPIEEVGRFLAGGRPVSVVAPPSVKRWDLTVAVPVADMSSLGEVTGDLSGEAAGPERRASIWPHVEERIVDLISEHRSTLVFANSRRLAERLTARLNEIWQERLDLAAAQDDEDDLADQSRDQPAGRETRPREGPGRPPWRPPAQLMAQAGQSSAAPATLARAHHGSVSKEQRAQVEDDLKAGRLPAVVATSSLELGIDMGAVDLVIQVESPPSVASGLQRVGRAGHQVGAVSRGVLFPKFRGDLVQTAVVVERMKAGLIEALHVPANPLDVLAQQIVAIASLDQIGVEELETLVRRAAPFATLPRSALEAVLDMLAGRYPSEEFAELRPRIVWDRVSDTLTGRPGAQRLAVTSGGTIPDRGLYGVFLAGEQATARRVGELDEEMVYESRVGDVFTLGTSSWRIEDITHDRVLVTPAPGQPGKLPFWKGDAQGRPAELGRALGGFVRELVGLLRTPGGRAAAAERVGAAGLDRWASDNLIDYLTEQIEATGRVADDHTIVIERFRDELGDWRIAVQSPFGAQVHAPWALCVSARMHERFGANVQAMHGDDGIVFRLPDIELDDGRGDGAADADLLRSIILDAAEVEELVTEQIGGSALFAARFRECAARALLLPRRRPDRRQALWQQRQRSAQLLQVASRYASFPIVLETVRECVQDVFDVPGLVELMGDIASRKVAVVEIESATPSPFARSLMFGYVAQFLYEGDSPLAERRAAALALDPVLLAELLGRGEGASLRDLLDPQALEHTEAELQRLAPERRARDGEDIADLVRVVGPLDHAGLLARCVEGTPVGDLSRWLVDLEGDRRLIRTRIGGQERWAAIEDAGRLRDALGVPLPVGIPEVFLEPQPDPLGDLLARYARTHVPFTVADVAAWYVLGPAVVATGLRRLVDAGRLVEGELRPVESGGSRGSTDFCDPQILRTLRRRSMAALRAEVEPVPAVDLARFLPGWQGVGALRGADGVVRAVEQLAGVALPVSALESLVLPSRVADYTPAMLDELTATGEVIWQGRGALSGDDGWVSLHLADSAALTMTPPSEESVGEAHRAVLDALGGGGAYFFRTLADTLGAGSSKDQALVDTLWELVWAGWLTNDTLAPLRALLSSGHSAHRLRRAPSRNVRHAGRARLGALGGRPSMRGPMPPGRTSSPLAAGRWSLAPQVDLDATARGYATAEVLLDRYGVLTRGSVTAEEVPGGFAGVYRVLAAAEESGRVRRGYFVEGLGAAQFAGTGAVDRLRAQSRPLPEADIGGELGQRRGTGHEPRRALVLAASDPANAYGAALPWPERPTESTKHRPARKAGSLVVLFDGELVLYVERGGRTLLSWTDDPKVLQSAADALALAVRDGALGRLTVERADGDAVLGSDHPLARALAKAGFHATPRGLRLRR